LNPGGRIQIGETEMIFDDGTYNSSMGATMITDNTTSLPEATIALTSSDRTTSGLLEAIEGARTKPEETPEARVAKRSDLLALISKVGITLLASASLTETLEQIVLSGLRSGARRSLPDHDARRRQPGFESSRSAFT